MVPSPLTIIPRKHPPLDLGRASNLPLRLGYITGTIVRSGISPKSGIKPKNVPSPAAAVFVPQFACIRVRRSMFR
jgi:hypothetical protein